LTKDTFDDTMSKVIVDMSDKKGRRKKQQRKSDRRRKERKKALQERKDPLSLLPKNKEKEKWKKANRTIKKETAHLPTKVIKEEVVKKGAKSGIIDVYYKGLHHKINVEEVTESLAIIEVNGKREIVELEGYEKVIRLNRQQLAKYRSLSQLLLVASQPLSP
jgi:hypothetical protein